MIYFVRAASGDGCIKIGYSHLYWTRMDSLQRGSPVPLVMLAGIKGEYPEETALHRRFAKDRAYGEWFKPSPALLAFIESAKKRSYKECVNYQDPPKKPRRGIWNAQAESRKTSRLPNYLLFSKYELDCLIDDESMVDEEDS